MQAAFARLGALPPPAAGAPALTRLDGACAGCAAYARELAIVQRVVGQALHADVLPDFRFAPIEKRADLVQTVLGIPLDRLTVGAPGRLLAAHARDPGRKAGDGAPEGLHLAYAAAF